jgi:hypothetical protein|tara:strand:+ start:1903 stop:2040 length:138 start_codon:yes stop_codon:yes gene_type:complete
MTETIDEQIKKAETELETAKEYFEVKKNILFLLNIEKELEVSLED